MPKRNPDRDITRLLGAGKIKSILSYHKDGDAEISLFDDGQTYIRLEEQDYYSYHDCSSSARQIEVGQNAEMWEMYNKEYFPSLSLP